MTRQEIEDEINQMLNSCDATATPLICRKKLTAAGRNYLISRIIHLVDVENVPLESTLAHIEQELDGL